VEDFGSIEEAPDDLCRTTVDHELTRGLLDREFRGFGPLERRVIPVSRPIGLSADDTLAESAANHDAAPAQVTGVQPPQR